MDVSLLTIGNMLGQPAGSGQVSPGSNAPARDTRFNLTREHPQPTADTTGPAIPPEARAETPVGPAPEGRKDFKEVIDNQRKRGNLEKTRDHRDPARQSTESDASDQPDAAQAGLAQNPAGADQDKETVTSTGKPEAPQQLVQFIERGDSQNTPPVIAENLESLEIKLAGTATNKQLGSEAVTPDSTKNISVDTASAKNAGKLPISDGATANAQAIPKGSDAKQLAPEASVIDGDKTAGAIKEQTIITDSPAAVPTKAPATGISTSTDDAAVDGGVRTKNASENTAVADAGKVQRSETAVQSTQTQSSVSNSAKIGASADNLPTTETEAGSASQRTPARPASANGRNSGHLGKNVENAPLEPGQVQVTANQAETGDSSHSGGGPLPDSVQILSPTPAQSPAFAVEAEPTTSAEQAATAPGGPLGDAGNQVLESVRTSLSQQTGDKEISIQLHPPELGKVSVKFQEQGSEITGTLEVSKAQTRAEIEQALPEIIRGLADSGVAIRRLEVVLSQDEQSQQHGSRDPLLRDGAFQQRDSANSGQSGNEQQTAQTYYGPSGRSAYQYQNPANPYEMLVTNTSIDMLV